MHRECWERFPRHRGLAIRHASRHVRHTRAVMPARIANQRFPLKSVVGKTFPAFAAHAQPAIYVSGKRPMLTLLHSLLVFLEYMPHVHPYKRIHLSISYSPLSSEVVKLSDSLLRIAWLIYSNVLIGQIFSKNYGLSFHCWAIFVAYTAGKFLSNVHNDRHNRYLTVFTPFWPFLFHKLFLINLFIIILFHSTQSNQTEQMYAVAGLYGSTAIHPQFLHISYNTPLRNRNVHICVLKWCIMRYWTGALLYLWNWFIVMSWLISRDMHLPPANQHANRTQESQFNCSMSIMLINMLKAGISGTHGTWQRR